jgi:preprotein translocase subunit SecA
MARKIASHDSAKRKVTTTMFTFFSRSSLRRYRAQVPRILAEQTKLAALTDDGLRRASLALRYRAQTGELLDRLLVEGFALVREAARRTLQMEHYDVQLIGGAALHAGSVVEMQTGEGKTLTATLPLYLAALPGKGAHLATANDYLAARDAEQMRPLFERLGLSVGAITAELSRSERRAAYACDVTYGTAKEFGFDFLRDRLAEAAATSAPRFGLDDDVPAKLAVQRAAFAMLVDEADSLLIDEARTPLVVSGSPGEDRAAKVAIYRWAAKVSPQFVEDEHYDYDAKTRRVTLTAAGRRRVRELTDGDEGLPHDAPLVDLYEHIEKAIRAARDFIRNRDYIVRDGEVVIVDEFTGRLAEGRRWRDGLHQAVEAREGLEIGLPAADAARITLQDFMLRYERLAGMTGTIATAAHELKSIYNTPVLVVPTHRPPQRMELPSMVLGTSDERWQAIVDEVQALHAAGRPVLIGTRSIVKSETLSRLLAAAGLEHQVLNARQIAAEADIIAGAGERGRITVATNMAGRGTDIRLGEGVRECGGLHVIISELHESARIDRQLIGRCGRQGDPGSYRRYLALDDDILLAAFGPERAASLRQRGERGGRFDHLAKLFFRAQANVERQHFSLRERLLDYERERRKMQEQLGQDAYLDAA